MEKLVNRKLGEVFDELQGMADARVWIINEWRGTCHMIDVSNADLFGECTVVAVGNDKKGAVVIAQYEVSDD